ncbi:hypothetical protein Cgig2_018023 [Carnegiea gigantea]|uniref:Retrotransposon Copia-like N-terminal domain-containing protein n=1 Tax=Carnegiea gigantea TaxID=171969 RepID=A0A9Q1JYK5_9CARY|nr:hypothetical protein Cgig2_018023 [Carnegiea gigantea]
MQRFSKKNSIEILICNDLRLKTTKLASRGRVNYANLQNPLFIHPSNGPRPLSVGEKLTGALNYQIWRRGMKIGLSTKHKLVFILVTLNKPDDDPIKTAQWETCNNLMISWISNNVSGSIARWSFYKYYAMLRGIWEELDAMNELPRITTGAEDVTRLLNALLKQQEELKMFQFLNGLDGKYQTLRSQMLIMNPLPFVETTYGMIPAGRLTERSA